MMAYPLTKPTLSLRELLSVNDEICKSSRFLELCELAASHSATPPVNRANKMTSSCDFVGNYGRQMIQTLSPLFCKRMNLPSGSTSDTSTSPFALAEVT